ncbi:hypothetical protein SAMN02745857_03922 [Andreprevotia lacus DSM 23236]|uniref:Uncharacterized protein n=2 Tax=Andreprevotia TaxID=397275 RepID=A0A1W1Y0A5_9NEIS|nr:hypothetical protein SAMN02745857_03922 [Andreprevotia lacus DSM 23236]
MGLAALTVRMHNWPSSDYRALLAEADGRMHADLLYRINPDYIYLRQLYVTPGACRQRLGGSWSNKPAMLPGHCTCASRC